MAKLEDGGRRTVWTLDRAEVLAMRECHQEGMSTWAISRKFKIGQPYTKRILSGEIYQAGPWPEVKSH